MHERATGIILRTRPLTDTSLIVNWLTPEAGRLATVAKGARRPKSPFAGKLDIFFLAEFSFVRSRRSELHILREVELMDSNPALREDLAWLQQAAYAAALIEQITETETPIPEYFDLLNRLLEFLPSQPARALTTFSVESKILIASGLFPDLASSGLSLGARQILDKCARLEWPSLARLVPSAAQTREIGRFLHTQLLQHLGRVPKGRDACV